MNHLNVVIQARDVRKDFVRPDGSIQHVLGGISFDICEGELVCVLGPSGCGKSTLLNLLAGFDTPTAGTISVYGRPVTRPSRDRVVVFQDAGSALFGWRTVRANVEYALKLRGYGDARTRRTMCDQFLSLVHLEHSADKYPYQLSGGEKQRAQIARALAADPEILLMDEPLGALDALTKLGLQREVVELVSRMRKTIVYVTHDIVESALISDRVIVLSTNPAIIRHDRAHSVQHPRQLSDKEVATLVRELEAIVMTDKVSP